MKHKKVLIADDNRYMLAALRTRLRDWGYAVVEVRDGLGVIAQATRAGVDALILDHEMPNGDGRTIAHLIRRETTAPIIFLSGYDRSTFRDTVFTLPEVYYLPKPLESERLERLLESCV